MIKFIRSKLFEIGAVGALIVVLLLVNVVITAIYDPAPPSFKPTPVATDNPLQHGGSGRVVEEATPQTALPAGCDADFAIPPSVWLYQAALTSGILEEDYAAIVRLVNEQWFIIDGAILLQLDFSTGVRVNIGLFGMCGLPDNAVPLIDVIITQVP